MDENNPIGAVCLEHGVVPEGHKGPLHDPPAGRPGSSVACEPYFVVGFGQRSSGRIGPNPPAALAPVPTTN